MKECQEKHDVWLRNGEHGFREDDTGGQVVVSFPGETCHITSLGDIIYICVCV